MGLTFKVSHNYTDTCQVICQMIWFSSRDVPILFRVKAMNKMLAYIYLTNRRKFK